ncbi:hypothetical protein Tco_0988884, partial [Tanacetum coccineum]
MSFDPRLFSYEESPICILALTSISYCYPNFDCFRNPGKFADTVESRKDFDVIGEYTDVQEEIALSRSSFHLLIHLFPLLLDIRFAMSSNNASSTVTYTFVSSDSNRPSSWGIPLENAGEIPDMDPYEEVAQQGQAHPLSPAYVPDPMELNEHVPLYAPEPEHPEHLIPADDDSQAEEQPYAEDASSIAESPGYIADSDSMEDDTDADSIDYPDEPEDSKDDDEDPRDERESEDEKAKEDESFEVSDETEPFEENETAATPPSPGCRGARITVRPQPPMATSTQALIDAFTAGSPSFPSPPPINPTYDQAPLGHRAAMIRMCNTPKMGRSGIWVGECYFIDQQHEI